MHRHPRPLVLLLAFALALVAVACGVRDEDGSSPTTAGSDGNGDGPQLPDCPVDALESASGVVEVELWHGLGSESENNLEALAEAYNAGQDEVKILVRNQGVSYDEVLRKYVAAIPSRQLPGIVYLEDT